MKKTVLDYPHTYKVDENGIKTLDVIIPYGEKCVVIPASQVMHMHPIVLEERLTIHNSK